MNRRTYVHRLLSLMLSLVGLSTLINADSIDSTGAGWINTHQIFTDGDTVQGFVSLKSGCDLAASSTVNFDCTGPINGKIKFGNNATMSLFHDLLLGSTASFSTDGSLGNVKGNGFSLTLTNSLFIPERVLFEDIVIDGRGNTLVISQDNAFNVYTDLSLGVTLKNMSITITTQHPFACLPENVSLTLQNVKLIIDTPTFTFHSGPSCRLNIEGDCSIEGVNGSVFQFFNNPDQEAQNILTLCSGATLRIDHNIIFDWQSGADALRMTDATSTLFLNGATLTVPSATGLRLLKGRLILDNKVLIDNEGNTDLTKGLILGDGVNASNNVDVNVLGGAYVAVNGSLWHNAA